MKILISLFICLTLSLAQAQPSSQAEREFSEAVWAAMIQEAQRSWAQQTASDIANQLAIKYFEQDISIYLNSYFSGYSAYKALRQYDESNSESDKFNALASGATSVIAVVAPPAALIAQIATFGMNLQSALIKKGYVQDAYRVYAEAIAKGAEYSELKKRQATYDGEFYIRASIRVAALGVLKDNLEKEVSAVCAVEINDDCLKNLLSLLFTTQRLQKSLKRLVSYTPYFFKLEDFAKHSKLPPDVYGLYLEQVHKQLDVRNIQMQQLQEIFNKAEVEMMLMPVE